MTETEGLKVFPSNFAPKATIARFEKAAREAGMTVFAVIDFAADAKKVGVFLDESILIIFGNPAVGTRVLQDVPQAGIDLPLKAFAWTQEGRHWLSCNEPSFLARRHGVHDMGTIVKMSEALNKIVTSTLQD